MGMKSYADVCTCTPPSSDATSFLVIPNKLRNWLQLEHKNKSVQHCNIC
jgi:hypothetical protein